MKPGIIYGNAITAAAGFFLASEASINLGLLMAMLIGLAFVIASGCVFNNYLDRELDKKMERTKNRALVTGSVSLRSALIYGSVLGIIGITVLLFYTNLLTTLIALIGLLTYVVVYGVAKRRSIHGTVIGSIAGAVPPVVGYTAAANRFDAGALLLLMILVFWQMPHFYAVAIRRLKDYTVTGLPILPVRAGVSFTKLQILVYIGLFLLASVLLAVFGYTGYLYLGLMILVSVIWLGLGIQGLKKESDDQAWAKQMFFFSLIVLMTFCISVVLDAVSKNRV